MNIFYKRVYWSVLVLSIYSVSTHCMFLFKSDSSPSQESNEKTCSQCKKTITDSWPATINLYVNCFHPQCLQQYYDTNYNTIKTTIFSDNNLKIYNTIEECRKTTIEFTDKIDHTLETIKNENQGLKTIIEEKEEKNANIKKRLENIKHESVALPSCKICNNSLGNTSDIIQLKCNNSFHFAHTACFANDSSKIQLNNKCSYTHKPLVKHKFSYTKSLKRVIILVSLCYTVHSIKKVVEAYLT